MGVADLRDSATGVAVPGGVGLDGNTTLEGGGAAALERDADLEWIGVFRDEASFTGVCATLATTGVELQGAGGVGVI
jgi:hypothetical protein